jgi:hypothetical protein
MIHCTQPHGGRVPDPEESPSLRTQTRVALVEKQKLAPPVPFTSLLTPDLVRISVGDPAVKFYHVHRDLLCSRDPVFNAGYGPNSYFGEGTSHSGELKLADQIPQVIDLFVHWLYSDNNNLPAVTTGGADLPTIKENSLPAYIHLYTFANSRCIATLEAKALKEIVAFYWRQTFQVLTPTLCLVFEVTPPKCRLRQFMARAWFYHQSRRGGSAIGQVQTLALGSNGFGEELVRAIATHTQWVEPDAGF